MRAKLGDAVRTGTLKTPRIMESLVDKFVIDVAAGSQHNLVLDESHKMYSWGSGMQGELGLGNDNIGNFKDAQPVKFAADVVQISAGVAHSCAITREGRLLVWGQNRQAQLGFLERVKEIRKPVLFLGCIEAGVFGQVNANGVFDVNFDISY